MDVAVHPEGGHIEEGAWKLAHKGCGQPVGLVARRERAPMRGVMGHDHRRTIEGLGQLLGQPGAVTLVERPRVFGGQAALF
ncbi:hypothetical protein D3C86_1983950 [compost metagenome]